MRISSIFFAAMLSCAALASGCAARTEVRKFPHIWPTSITYTLPPEEPLEKVGPIILVSNLVYPEGTEGSGQMTADILTGIFAQRLQRKGLDAREAAGQDPEAGERLDCSLDKLTYTIQGNYPRSTLYEAELSCTLQGVGADKPRWKQSLAQRYERVNILNTMTNLPVEYEKILFKECIVPLLDAMAVSLRTHLKYSGTLPEGYAKPAPASEPAGLIERSETFVK